MVTGSSSERAGCRTRKIFPDHGSPGFRPSCCHRESLKRSAATASSGGSSRTRLGLFAVEEFREKGAPAATLETVNWPEKLWTTFWSEKANCPRATASETNRPRNHRATVARPVNFFSSLGGRLGFRLRRRLGVAGGFFGRLLVIVAAVIGDVKAAALEDQPRAAADFFFTRPRPHFFLVQTVFGTNFQRGGGHGLAGLKLKSAFFTDVFVSRHGFSAKSSGGGRRHFAGLLVPPSGGMTLTLPSEPTSTLRS